MEEYYKKDTINKKHKEIDNIDLDLLQVASMNEYVVATEDKPIIGTYALATCLGIILDDKEGNYVLGHILNNYEQLIKEMLNHLKNTGPIKVIIIPGYYTTTKKIYEVIEHLKSKDNYFLYDFEIEIKNLKDYINEELTSVEYAFDTRNKEFIKPDYNQVFIKEEELAWKK